jgi:hypothetical protein
MTRRGVIDGDRSTVCQKFIYVSFYVLHPEGVFRLHTHLNKGDRARLASCSREFKEILDAVRRARKKK